jgi:hypothetical protein
MEDLDLEVVESRRCPNVQLGQTGSSKVSALRAATSAAPSSDRGLGGQNSGDSSRFMRELQPALSRGALETSAAHLRDSSAYEEPFVDLLGVQVSSAYLKAGTPGASNKSFGCCAIM